MNILVRRWAMRGFLAHGFSGDSGDDRSAPSGPFPDRHRANMGSLRDPEVKVGHRSASQGQILFAGNCGRVDGLRGGVPGGGMAEHILDSSRASRDLVAAVRNRGELVHGGVAGVVRGGSAGTRHCDETKSALRGKH